MANKNVKIESLIGNNPTMTGYYTVGVQNGITKKANLKQLERLVTQFDRVCIYPQNFSESTAYEYGDYVMKDSSIWMFMTTHSPGPWTGLDASLSSCIFRFTKALTTNVHVQVSSIDASFDHSNREIVVETLEGTDIHDELYTNALGKCDFKLIPQSKYKIYGKDIPGYEKTARYIMHGYLNDDDTYIYLHYAKHYEPCNLKINFSIVGTGSISDFNGKDVFVFYEPLKQVKIGTIADASVVFQIPIGAPGVVSYPTVSGYATITQDNVNPTSSSMTINKEITTQ